MTASCIKRDGIDAALDTNTLTFHFFGCGNFFGAAGVVRLGGRRDNTPTLFPDHSAATLIVIGIVIGGIRVYTVSTDLMERG